MVRFKKRSYKSFKRGASSKAQRKIRLILFVVGMLLVGVGLNAVRNWYIIQHAGVPAGHTVATESTDAPSEQSVPDSYSVPADKPLSINLPTIKAKGFIQQVGVDKDNRMVVPGNVNMAGWYTKGALPGDSGLSIIDGHVHGLYAEGIFYRLGKLKVGDAFTVTFGDKSVRNFKVKAVQKVTTKQADTALFVRDNAIAKQLNLITCTGKFDKASKSYDSRVIVVAEAY